MILAKGHVSVLCQHFQRASPLKLLGQFHLNFICSLLGKVGWSGGAMVLGNLPVPGRPTNFD